MHNYNIEVGLCLKVKKLETAGRRENTGSKGIDDPSSLKEDRCVIMSYQNEECSTNYSICSLLVK